MNILNESRNWDKIPLGRGLSLLFRNPRLKAAFSFSMLSVYSNPYNVMYRESNGVITTNHFDSISVSVW